MLDAYATFAIAATPAERRSGNGGRRVYEPRRTVNDPGYDAPLFAATSATDIHAFIRAYDAARDAAGRQRPGVSAVLASARQRGFTRRMISSGAIRHAWRDARHDPPGAIAA